MTADEGWSEAHDETVMDVIQLLPPDSKDAFIVLSAVIGLFLVSVYGERSKHMLGELSEAADLWRDSLLSKGK